MPTTDAGAGSLPPVDQLRDSLRAACGPGAGGLYVLLDAARIPNLGAILREFKASHGCLFRKSPRENLSHVAPFVAHCPVDGDLPFWLAIQEHALEAALFLVTAASPGELYTHLRRYLLVVDTAGKENYFRFYDPRVLQPFLASSTPAEKAQFFGPIRCFMAYDAAASQASGVLSLRRWMTPPPVAAESAHPPSATAKFQLSPQHEEEFSRDVMERYDRRCMAMLRSRYSCALQRKTDGELRALVNDAKVLGPALDLPSGRDVAIVSELLVLGFSPELRNKVAAIPRQDRPRAIQLLRDRLALLQLSAGAVR